MRYRRAYLRGGTYFFTVNLKDRNSTLLTDNVDLLRHAVSIVKERHPFVINAAVVMPEHLHMVWTLPEHNDDFSTRWRLVKRYFSQEYSKRFDAKKDLWQPRFWEHQIRDQKDLTNHINYIHYNPVKHGCVTATSDWAHSSIHKFLREDKLPANWGNNIELDKSARFGERS